MQLAKESVWLSQLDTFCRNRRSLFCRQGLPNQSFRFFHSTRVTALFILYGAAFAGDAGVAACVAGSGGGGGATWTVSPACDVSDGLSITLSCGERPAVTSTVSPKSRPS